MSDKNKNNKVAEDGTTEVLEASTPTEQPKAIPIPDEKLNAILAESLEHESVETKEPTGTTTEVKKVVVPHKVESSKLDSYDTAIINLVLGSNLLDNVVLAYRDAPMLQQRMIETAKSEYHQAHVMFMSLASEVIEPDSQEEIDMENAVLAKKAKREEIAKLQAMSIDETREATIKAMRDSLIRDIESIRLSVFGKETTNSGGKPTPGGKALDWQHETTISYWRNSSFLQICPVAWLSVEFREAHELQANWYIAFDGKSGEIVYKISSATTYSNLFFQITQQQVLAKGEELPTSDTWGKNQTLLGSTTTDKQKIEYAGLSQEKLRELVGDKGNDFTLSISEEIGQDDSTALPQPTLVVTLESEALKVETIESGESVTA